MGRANGGVALADTTEPTRHGFTPEQMDWIERRLEAHTNRYRSGNDRGGELSMLKWAIGGLFVLGLATAGYLATQMQSVENELRTEIGSVREELRGEIAANRSAIAELAEGQARIEAILEERLPRDR